MPLYFNIERREGMRMNRKKRKIAGIVMLVLILCYCQSISAKMTEIAPQYVNTSSCSISMAINGVMANCLLNVKGKDGTTKISGTLKLYDVTDKKSIKRWPISINGTYYSGLKTATVKSGHKYKLSFSGKVYDSKNKGESISATKTKQN